MHDDSSFEDMADISVLTYSKVAATQVYGATVSRHTGTASTTSVRTVQSSQLHANTTPGGNTEI